MSVAPRLYLDAALFEGAELTLDRDQAHYLFTVMRRKAGDAVRVFNARDGEWSGEVGAAARKGATLVLSKRLRAPSTPPDLMLCFAPVKKSRTDFIVEKATELGATVIQPVMTRRTVAERVKTARLSALVREAAEQTERLDLPEVREPIALSALLADWDAARRLVYADEAGDDAEAPWGGEAGRAPTMLEVLRAGEARSWAVLIGPEGGFDPQERALLREQAFVTAVSLGPRILRADTAAAAALTLWQAALGDWR